MLVGVSLSCQLVPVAVCVRMLQDEGRKEGNVLVLLPLAVLLLL
jgi:hypothetical protein